MAKVTKNTDPVMRIIVDRLAKKYGVTARYIRMSVNRERNGVFPDKMRLEFNEEYEKMTAVTDSPITAD